MGKLPRDLSRLINFELGILKNDEIVNEYSHEIAVRNEITNFFCVFFKNIKSRVAQFQPDALQTRKLPVYVNSRMLCTGALPWDRGIRNIFSGNIVAQVSRNYEYSSEKFFRNRKHYPNLMADQLEPILLGFNL